MMVLASANARGRNLRRSCGALLESLESRVLMSIVTWTGAGGNAFWSNKDNWDSHAAPTNGDDVVVQGTTTDDITGLVLHNLAFSGNSTFTTAAPSGEPIRLTVTNNVAFAGTVNYYGLPLIMTGATPVITTAAGASVLWSAPATVANAILTLTGSGSLTFGNGALHSTLFVLTAETHITDGNISFAGAASGKVVVTGGTANFFISYPDYPLAGLQATGGTVKLSSFLTVAGDVLLGAGSTYVGGYPLNANGNVTLGATLSPTTNYDLITKNSAGPVVGTFAGLPDGAIFDVNGTPHRIYYHASLAGDGNDVYQAIGTFNTVVPTLQNPALAIGDTSTTFSITFSDNAGVDPAAIQNAASVVTVSGPNGYSTPATLVSVAGSANSQVATYRISAPGGSWGSDDNGAYTVTVQGPIVAGPGNPSVFLTVGTFAASLGGDPGPDQRIFLHGNPDVRMAGGVNTTISLAFLNDSLVSTFQNNNHLVKVTGPHGAVAYAQFVGLSTLGGAHLATFQFIAPGGTWDGADIGAYTVSIAGQTVVTDGGAPPVFYVSPNVAFDERYYEQHNADVAAAIKAGVVSSGWVHFEKYGQFENRDPSAIFDGAMYLQLNPDVAAAVKAKKIVSGFDHFLRFGLAEGRPVTPLFDNGYYLAHNSDVAAAVNRGALSSGLLHYVVFGQYEPRDPSAYFDVSYYSQHNAGVAPTVTDGRYASLFQQFLVSGQESGSPASTLFDETFYLARYPDVAAAVHAGAFKSGLEHFLLYGRKEGRLGVGAV